LGSRDAAADLAADSEKITRVVAHRDFRTSFKLERVYWGLLERMAAARNQRLGALIAGIAASYTGNNLTAHLRAICVREAVREARTAEANATPDLASRLFDSCPAPGLLLGQSAEILTVNGALRRWLDDPRLIGLTFAEAFRVRAQPSFDHVWASMLKTGRTQTGIGAIYIRAGRVTAAEVTLVPAYLGRIDPPVIAWMASRGSRSAGTAG
jgi:predicted DNA-binding ribbon-helix-helix protein